MNLFRSLFGSANDRALKKIKKTVAQVNQLEEKFKNFSNKDLKNQTWNHF